MVGGASGPEMKAPPSAEGAAEAVESWTVEAEALEAADVAETAGMTAGACAASTAAAVTEALLPVIGSCSSPISEVDFRELYYSQAGGYQQVWQAPGAPDWLGRLRRRRLIAGRDVGALIGRNTYVELSQAAARAELPTLRVALTRGGAGTRVTVVTGTGLEEELREAGFELLGRLTAADGAPRVAMAAGRRRGVWREHRLDHAAVREHLDPRDRGEGPGESSIDKSARSWRPMAWEPDRWRGKGLPPAVEKLMTEGARIAVSEEVGFEEVPQYAWPTDEALAEGILEADRALAVGAMNTCPTSIWSACWVRAQCIRGRWLSRVPSGALATTTAWARTAGRLRRLSRCRRCGMCGRCSNRARDSPNMTCETASISCRCIQIAGTGW